MVGYNQGTVVLFFSLSKICLKMKVLVVLAIFVAVATAAPLTKDELALLEAFDYEALFANDENRKMVFDCLLDKGDCEPYKTVVDLSLKIIQSNCEECSPAQKAKYDGVLKVLHDKYEPFYNELMKKLISKKE